MDRNCVIDHPLLFEYKIYSEDKAFKKAIKKYKRDIDYKIIDVIEKDKETVIAKKIYRLSYDCFVNLCLKSRDGEADVVRNCVIDCIDIINKYKEYEKIYKYKLLR